MSTEERRGRRRAAALRLKHDLGKYVRFAAPARREADVGALRARLRADLLETRRSGGAARSAVDVFREWESEERGLFDADDADLETLARAVSRLEELLPTLSGLEERRLVELDELSLEIARRCRSLVLRSSK
ncbi:MAG TPA: hypothetical protein VLH41_07415 [Thermoanaerobaculia bacterium]|nr:hypothetical protein [Thermoanaerobaculia bacterium]